MRVSSRTTRWNTIFLVTICHSRMTLTTITRLLTISVITGASHQIPTLDIVSRIIASIEHLTTKVMIATCLESRRKGLHTWHLSTTMSISGLRHRTDTTITMQIQFTIHHIWDILSSKECRPATKSKRSLIIIMRDTTNGTVATRPICINRSRVVASTSSTVTTESIGTIKMEMQHKADMFKTSENTTIDNKSRRSNHSFIAPIKPKDTKMWEIRAEKYRIELNYVKIVETYQVHPWTIKYWIKLIRYDTMK